MVMGRLQMTEKRENNFGIIRLIGAVMVIVGHMYVLLGQSAPSILWNTVNSLGVAVFFGIGGYLITLSWLKDPNFIRYIIKRVFRIFPALIVCVLISVFIVGPIATEMPSLREYFTHIMTWRYMRNIILYMDNHALPMVFYDNPYPAAVNGSLWCLPVEFLMYLIIPVYLSIGNKITKKYRKIYFLLITLLSIGVGCVYAVGAGMENIRLYGMFISQIVMIVPYYFVGSLIAVCKLEKNLNLQMATVLLILSAGFSYLPEPFAHLAAYILVPYVFLSFALTEKPVFAKLNKLDISYGMFLFSFVIQQSLIQIFMKCEISLNFYVLLVLSLLLSIGMGIVTERLVERPAQKISKKLVTLCTKEQAV